MRIVALILLMMCLLQPLACYADPCDSCLDTPDIVDTSGTSFPVHDSDNCNSTVCCAECIAISILATVTYAPLVSAITVSEQERKLPTVVMPIFIPPQNPA